MGRIECGGRRTIRPGRLPEDVFSPSKQERHHNQATTKQQNKSEPLAATLASVTPRSDRLEEMNGVSADPRRS
jgi:hypothetical protein